MCAAQPGDGPRRGGYLIGGRSGPALGLLPLCSTELALGTAIQAVDATSNGRLQPKNGLVSEAVREPTVLSGCHVSRSTAAALSLRVSGTSTALGLERDGLR